VSENTGHGRIETRTCTVVSYGSIMENPKRLKAGWDEKYLSQLLQKNNF